MLKRLRRSSKVQSIAVTAIMALTGMAVFASLARILDKEVFGNWIFFLAVYTLLDMLRSGIIQMYFTKAWKEEEIPRSELVSASWRLAFITIGVLAAACGIAYLLPIGLDLNWLVALWVVFTFSTPFALTQILLNAREDYIGGGRSRWGQQLVLLAGIWIIQPEDIYTVIAVYLAANVLLGIVAAFQGKLLWHGLGAGKNTARSMWKYGRFTSVTLVSSNLLRSSDTYILMYFIGAFGVGIYAVPERVVGVIFMLITALMGTIIPKLASYLKEHGVEGMGRQAEREMGFMFWVMVPIVAFLLLFAPFVVYIIAGEGFEDSVVLLRIFCIYLLLLPFDRMTGVVLELLGKPNLNSIKVVLMVAFNVIGDVIVLSLGGSWNEVGYVTTGTLLVGVIYGFIQISSIEPLNPLRAITSGLKMIRTLVKDLPKKL